MWGLVFGQRRDPKHPRGRVWVEVLGCPSLQLMGLDGHKGWEGAAGLGVTVRLPSLVRCGHRGVGWGGFPESPCGLSSWVWEEVWGPASHVSFPLAHLGGLEKALSPKQVRAGRPCTEAPAGPPASWPPAGPVAWAPWQPAALCACVQASLLTQLRGVGLGPIQGQRLAGLLSGLQRPALPLSLWPDLAACRSVGRLLLSSDPGTQDEGPGTPILLSPQTPPGSCPAPLPQGAGVHCPALLRGVPPRPRCPGPRGPR